MELGNRGLKRYIFGDRQFYKMVFAIVIPIIIQNTITLSSRLTKDVMVFWMMMGITMANTIL